jgi:DNA-directed RNA polymerase subunit RPC12/RpoP
VIELFVTCPKCGAKIRDTDTSCPSCGLRDAGIGSKEYNEELVRRIKKTMSGYGTFPGSSSFTCIDGSAHENYGSFIGTRVVKEGGLYVTVITYKCSRCGKKVRTKTKYI